MYKSHTVGGGGGWFVSKPEINTLQMQRGKKKTQASDVMQRVCKGAVAAFLSDIVVALDPVSVHQLRG